MFLCVRRRHRTVVGVALCVCVTRARLTEFGLHGSPKKQEHVHHARTMFYDAQPDPQPDPVGEGSGATKEDVSDLLSTELGEERVEMISAAEISIALERSHSNSSDMQRSPAASDAVEEDRASRGMSPDTLLMRKGFAKLELNAIHEREARDTHTVGTPVANSPGRARPKLAKSRAEVERLTVENEQLRQALATATAMDSDYLADQKRVTDEVLSLENTVRALVEENKTLKANVEVLENSLRVDVTTIEGLTKKWSEGNLKNEKLRKRLGTLDLENKEMKRKHHRAYAERDDEVKRLVQELKDMTNKFEGTSSMVSAVRKESAEETSRLEHLVAELRRELQERNAAVEMARTEASVAESAEKALREKLASESGALHDRIESLEALLAASQQRIAHVETELTESRAQVAGAEEARATSEEKVRRLSQATRAHRKSISHSLQEVQEQSILARDRGKLIEELKVDLERMGKDVLDSEADLKAVNMRNVTLSKDFHDMRERGRAMKEELAELRAQLGHERAEKKELVEKLKHVRGRRARDFNANAERIALLENMIDQQASFPNAAVESKTVLTDKAVHQPRDAGSSGALKRLLDATTKELRLKASALASVTDKYVVATRTVSRLYEEIDVLRSHVANVNFQ